MPRACDNRLCVNNHFDKAEMDDSDFGRRSDMLKKLDKKALIAGVLLLLNVRLWLITAGFGSATELLTSIIADNSIILPVAAALIAGILVVIRRRIIAVIGLAVLAVYYLIATIPTITGSNFDWVKEICLVVAIALAAVCIFFGDNDGMVFQILRGIAIAGVIIWWYFTYLPGIAEDVYVAMDKLEATILIIRNDLLALAVAFAATVKLEAPAE